MDDVKITQCKFSAEIVPYMYGELSAAESASFESHLLDCGDCTDEFAAISSARYEVYDWKKLEFDPLPTPVVQIPYETQSEVSWIEKVRAAFSQSWAVPTVAFAGLAIVAILAAVFVSSRDSGTEVVREIGNSNSDAVVVPSPVVDQPTAPVLAGEVAKDEKSASKSAERLLNVAAPKNPERRAVRRDVRSVQPKAVEARQATTRNEPEKIPRLNDFADDEDTSLRLAELFEDVETRE